MCRHKSFIYCVFTPCLPPFSEQYLLSSSQPSSLSSSSVQTLKLIVRDSEAASALNETVNWVLTTFPSFDCPHNMSSLIHFYSSKLLQESAELRGARKDFVLFLDYFVVWFIFQSLKVKMRNVVSGSICHLWSGEIVIDS